MTTLIFNPVTPTGTHRTIIRVLKDAGIVPCTLPDEIQLLKELLASTTKAFDQEARLQNVAIVYLYDQLQQKKDSPLKGVDAIDLKHERRGVSFHSIGIEIRAIHRHDAKTYVPALLLHELSHTYTGPDHDDAFEQQYNILLAELKKRTGIICQNDYVGYTGPDQPTEITD